MPSIIQNIIYVYFTPLPYTIYNTYTREGNMAWAGIGLGLINSQRLFWISNMGIIVVIYNKNIYLDFILLCICGFLYTVSFKKTIELIQYFEIER